MMESGDTFKQQKHQWKQCVDEADESATVIYVILMTHCIVCSRDRTTITKAERIEEEGEKE